MIYFPHPLLTRDDGMLAIGGDLSPERLLFAYQNGIFPWYNEGPILWWFTHPRPVLIPNEIRVPKSMQLIIQKTNWHITINRSFRKVMESCAEIKRPGQLSTWITDDMISAYVQLHHLGYAHSMEVWDNKDLVGGLYGVAVGKIFTGESMFTKKSNASKYALIRLARLLDHLGFWFIDCQQDTDHLKSMGTRLISKEDFWSYLTRNRFEENVFLNYVRSLKT